MNGKSHSVFGIVEDVPGYEGKIPMIQEKGNSFSFPKKMWKLPGGRGEFGEDAELTLIRELQEEIGINIFLPASDMFKKETPEHTFKVMRAKYYNGALKLGEEVECVFFFSRKEIETLIDYEEILPNHAEALKAYLRQKNLEEDLYEENLRYIWG